MTQIPDTMFIFEIGKSDEVQQNLGLVFNVLSSHEVKTWAEIGALPFIEPYLGDDRRVYFHWMPNLGLYAITKEEYLDDDAIVLGLAKFKEPPDSEAVDHLAKR